MQQNVQDIKYSIADLEEELQGIIHTWHSVCDFTLSDFACSERAAIACQDREAIYLLSTEDLDRPQRESCQDDESCDNVRSTHYWYVISFYPCNNLWS